jgi:hypothetical protein
MTSKKWESIINGISIEDNTEYRLLRQGSVMSVQKLIKEPEWVDITNECCIKQEESKRNTGIFAMLIHGETTIAYFCLEWTDRYKIELAKGATISFSVFMKNK